MITSNDFDLIRYEDSETQREAETLISRLLAERDAALKELDKTTECLIEEQKMRDAYREVAKQFRKDLFDKMRIPYDHDPEICAEVDAEAARILERK